MREDACCAFGDNSFTDSTDFAVGWRWQIFGQTGFHAGQDLCLLSGGVELLQVRHKAGEPANRL